jgi:hypothetical protein
MARPKKLSDTDAIILVESLYEKCGDPAMLKFSELEKHAAVLGINAKAYDLRRCPAVLKRIAEIEAVALNSDDAAALAYKGLDIDGFVRLNRTPDRLKRSLSELDERWRKLYDYAVGLSERSRAQSDDLRSAETLIGSLKAENIALSGEAAASRKSAAALKAENAHLRGTLKTYLYPALADEILRNLGEHTADYDSSVTQTAIDAMVDGDTPGSVSESAVADVMPVSREDVLLERLRLEAQEGGRDA